MCTASSFAAADWAATSPPRVRSLGGGEITEYTQLLEDTRRQAIDRMVAERDPDGRQCGHLDALRQLGDGQHHDRDRRLRHRRHRSRRTRRTPADDRVDGHDGHLHALRGRGAGRLLMLGRPGGARRRRMAGEASGRSVASAVGRSRRWCWSVPAIDRRQPSARLARLARAVASRRCRPPRSGQPTRSSSTRPAGIGFACIWTRPRVSGATSPKESAPEVKPDASHRSTPGCSRAWRWPSSLWLARPSPSRSSSHTWASPTRRPSTSSRSSPRRSWRGRPEPSSPRSPPSSSTTSFSPSPTTRFTIRDPGEWLSVILLLFVGIVVGQLAALQRSRTGEALAREREARALFQVSRALATRESTAEVLPDHRRDRFATRRAWTGSGSRSETVPASGWWATAAEGSRPSLPALQRVLRRMPGNEPAQWLRIHQPAQSSRGARVSCRARGVSRPNRGEQRGDRLDLGAHGSRSTGDPDRTETRLLAAAADQAGAGPRARPPRRRGASRRDRSTER